MFFEKKIITVKMAIEGGGRDHVLVHQLCDQHLCTRSGHGGGTEAHPAWLQATQWWQVAGSGGYSQNASSLLGVFTHLLGSHFLQLSIFFHTGAAGYCRIRAALQERVERMLEEDLGGYGTLTEEECFSSPPSCFSISAGSFSIPILLTTAVIIQANGKFWRRGFVWTDCGGHPPKEVSGGKGKTEMCSGVVPFRSRDHELSVCVLMLGHFARGKNKNRIWAYLFSLVQKRIRGRYVLRVVGLDRWRILKLEGSRLIPDRYPRAMAHCRLPDVVYLTMTAILVSYKGAGSLKFWSSLKSVSLQPTEQGWCIYKSS